MPKGRTSATSVPDLLRQLLADDPGRPRLTWYGEGFERIELSAKTLENWVAKTANFLLDEVEAEPGTTVGIDLPGHWRSVVWLLATWTVGAHAVIPPEALAPAGTTRLDAVVTTHVAAPPSVVTGALVVASLPALATRYNGELPVGAIDAATEVRLQPDAFPSVARPSPDAPAFTVTGEGGHPVSLSHGELFTLAADAPAESERLLSDAGPQFALDAYLRPLLAGGSVVLHHDLAALTPVELEHLIAQENVTRRTSS